MKRQCAWCHVTFGEKPPFDDDRISHGICPACRKKLLKAAGLPNKPSKKRKGKNGDTGLPGSDPGYHDQGRR